MPKYSGAKILCESLIKCGVDVIFGIPGGAVLPIFDELYRYQDKIKFILHRQEQAAGFAADAYARALGKPGVAIATSGPGATNLITAISNAKMDCVPLITITGNVPSHLIGKDAFQEVDVIGITKPITKANFLVTKPSQIEKVVFKAFEISISGKPGPVHIDITKDAQIKNAKFKMQNSKLQFKIQKCQIKKEIIEKKKLEEFVKLLNSAERPVVIAGHGIIISQAYKELKEFIKITKIPVINTLLGLTSFPQNSKYWFGLVGMHGFYCANLAIPKADLIIAIGTRFSDRVTGDIEKFQLNKKIVHIDISNKEIGKNVKVNLGILGDAKQVLSQINEYLEKIDFKSKKEWKEFVKYLEELKEKCKLKEIKPEDLHSSKTPKIGKTPVSNPPSNLPLTSAEVVSLISLVTSGKAIICADVGQNQMYAALYYRFKYENSYFASGGLGSMGYGVPAAIGAKIAMPKRDVWAIVGDGGFQMNMQELGTISHYNIPIKIVILNNSYLGMVKQWQDLFYGKRLSYTYLKNPDFCKIAESYGIKAKRIKTWKQAVEGVKWANSIKKEPVILEFLINPNQHVYPMVPPGKSLEETIL